MSRFAAMASMMRLVVASSRPTILNIPRSIVAPAAAMTARHSLLSVDSLGRLPFDFSRSYARSRGISSDDEDEDEDFGDDFEGDEDFVEDLDDEEDSDDEEEEGDENGVPIAMK